MHGHAGLPALDPRIVHVLLDLLAEGLDVVGQQAIVLVYVQFFLEEMDHCKFRSQVIQEVDVREEFKLVLGQLDDGR